MIEVDEEAEWFIREGEVGEELGFVDGEDFVDGFESEDESVVDDDIDAVGVFDFEALVSEWKENLSFAFDILEFEFVSECFLVASF